MAGETMQGRLVAELQFMEKPGDYVILRQQSEGGGPMQITALWFISPNGLQGRVPAVGHGRNGEPEWSVVADGNGAATVSPSIDYRPSKFADGTESVGWHGFLERGIWRAA